MSSFEEAPDSAPAPRLRRSGVIQVVGVSMVLVLHMAIVFMAGHLAEGRVYCWGSDDYGQLASTRARDAGEPVVVDGLPTPTTSITAGGLYSCAIANGDVCCWGEDGSGQPYES